MRDNYITIILQPGKHQSDWFSLANITLSPTERARVIGLSFSTKDNQPVNIELAEDESIIYSANLKGPCRMPKAGKITVAFNVTKTITSSCCLRTRIRWRGDSERQRYYRIKALVWIVDMA